MNWLSTGEAMVTEMLAFDVAGVTMLQVFEENARILGIGAWLAAAGGIEVAMLQSLPITLVGGLLANRLYRQGKYLKALSVFVAFYEANWFVAVLFYAAAGKLPMAVIVVGLMGWNFFAISCIGALLVFRAGFGHLLVGVPGLTIRFLIAKGVLRP